MTLPEQITTLATQLRTDWLNDATPSGVFAWFAQRLQAERDAHAAELVGMQAVHESDQACIKACLAEKPKPEDVEKVAALVIAAARRAWGSLGNHLPAPPPEVLTGIAEAIVAAYGPLPDIPTIRTGSGLTETQRAHSASRKRTDADDIKALAADLEESFHWSDSVEGDAFWRAIHNRLLEMAAALRASAGPPTSAHIHGFEIAANPGARLVGVEAHQHGALSPEAARVLAAALCDAADQAEAAP